MQSIYSASLEEMFKHNSTELLTCSSLINTKLVVECFFKHAQEYVHIFSSHLDSGIFDDPRIVACAKDALCRGIAIKACTQTLAGPSEFKELIGELTEGVGATLPYEFIVVDGKAFIFKVINRVTASVFAKAPKLAGELEGIFLRLQKSKDRL